MNKTVIAVVVLLGIICGPATVDSAEKANPQAVTVAKELLHISGAGELGEQMLDQMIAAQKQASPQVPEKFWTDFRSEVNTEELIDLVAPVYARHFTVDEMQQLIQFYKTPVGKKLVQKLPVISSESMAAGQKWGFQLGMRIAQKLAAQQNK